MTPPVTNMTNRIAQVPSIGFLVGTVGLTIVSAGAQAGNLVDIGAATAHAINNTGQVALDQGIYSSGTITPLPILPGVTTPASALAINASGKVAGTALAPASGFLPAGSVPIAYDGTTLTDISMLLPAYLSRAELDPGSATGINSSNLVVGWYADALDIHGFRHGFTYSSGTVTNIDVPCSVASSTATGTCSDVVDNYPYGINTTGQIAGSVDFSRNAPQDHAYAYIDSNGSWTTLGVGASYALNDSGQVTGTLTTANGTSAFLYANGTTTDLGTLAGGKNSTGYAINATAQVVGSSDFTASTATHGIFYNGVMTDLNSMIDSADPLRTFVTLTDARGINDSRVIVANGVDSRDSLTHAYLLQAPFIDLAPGSLTFASTTVGATAAAQSVTVSNAGAAALPLGTVSTSSNFSIQNNDCGTSIAAGSHCTIGVAYTPIVAGQSNGGLTVPTAGTNFVVALSGTSPLAATLTASSATATVGSQITLTWTSSAGSTCAATGGSPNSSPPFSGSIQPNGSTMLTETAPGTVNYGIHCTAPGATAADPVAAVTWTWPAVTATVSASPTTITEGGSTTLTWGSTNATSCTATGGEPGDGWSGTKATSGTQSLPESFKLASSSVTLTFGITCTSSASSLSAQASADVVVNDPPATSGGGGGGALDLLSLGALLGVWKLRRRMTGTATRSA